MFTILKLSDINRARTSAQIVNPFPTITDDFAIIPKENIIKKLMIDPNLVKGDITLIEVVEELFQICSDSYVGVVDLVIGNILHYNTMVTRPENIDKLLNIPRISYIIKYDIDRGRINITYTTVKKFQSFGIPREIKDQFLEVDYVIGKGINNYLTEYNEKLSETQTNNLNEYIKRLSETQTKELALKLADFIIKFEDLAKNLVEIKKVISDAAKSSTQ